VIGWSACIKRLKRTQIGLQRIRGGYAGDDVDVMWDIQGEHERFKENNPLMIPRSYVAGRGRKDWRGKSPEYSDPDLPDLNEAHIPVEKTEEQWFPIPASVVLAHMREKGLNVSTGNKTSPKAELYENLRHNQPYHNDSWDVEYLSKAYKRMERKIRKPFNMTSKHLTQIADTRGSDPLLIKTICPHLENVSDSVMEQLSRNINETLPW